ncbi:MAG: succinate dehydrogenase iron-sulfur subunit [Gemmatimonadota bacterium]|jgi:succinate dehydrogenase / fumarate reductase iron-sulfur subunit|nr:succinate dehydrogenase iron-sulfur subunit [Gemmatimonadota bacterium]
MRVKFKIYRYQPEVREEPYFDTFEFDAEPTDRVLDGLNHIRWQMDGTLVLRRSCQQGICGSDAMRINGANRLACKVLIGDVGAKITIEPLMGFRVIKDLVVDMDDFFEQYRSVLPYMITEKPPPEVERLQSPAEREVYDDTTKCILCAACTTACPSFWSNRDFVGPAAIVQAHRFIFDSRDEGTDERLEVLGERDGVWRCRTIFNCTEACPRDIKITRAIGEVKKAIALKGA